jgi:hypothetical protein
MKKVNFLISFVLIIVSGLISDLFTINAAKEAGQCIRCVVQEAGYFLCKTDQEEGGFSCTVSGDGQQCTETDPCPKKI